MFFKQKRTAEKVSNKQRIKTRDPLPEHPTEHKKTVAYSVVHYWLYPHVMDGMPNIQAQQDYWAVCRVKAFTMCLHVASIFRVYLGLGK